MDYLLETSDTEELMNALTSLAIRHINLLDEASGVLISAAYDGAKDMAHLLDEMVGLALELNTRSDLPDGIRHPDEEGEASDD